MKQKIFRMFFPALLACFMLAGCKKSVGTPEDNAIVEEEPGEEEEDTGYVFGYSCIDMDNPYFDTLRRSLENTLGENEYRLISKNPGSDAQVQAAQLQELMDEGVDAVFLCPVDWEAVTPALEALQEAGIPVINIDTQVKEESLTKAYIGSDIRNAGYVCGEDLIKRGPRGGKILLLECPSINSINERITGFEQAIANAGFEVLDRADVNGEKEKAKEAMGEFLEKYPKIDGVMCGNDQVALGALEAVKESGRQGIRIYGVDGSPDIKKELKKAENQIAGTAAQSPINMGKQAAVTVMNILKGEDYEKEVYEEVFMINKDNVDMYGTDGWQ